MPRFDTVSFLSDYGTTDEFVGVVKSIIRSIAPHVVVIDVTHDIAPHDVRAGSLTLARSVQYLAPGVVLAVVDPGVGTDRRAVAVEVGDGPDAVFVGPDNGLLASAVAICGGARRCVSLTDAQWHLDAPGATFAGRDVFAPVAAQVCNGVDLDDLGERIEPLTLLPGILPLTRLEGRGVVGEVLWVDRFGNVQLNVDPAEVAAMGANVGDPVRLRFGGVTRTATLARSYAEVGHGAVGLVVDSYGMLSIVVDRGSASSELGLGPGVAVTLEPVDERLEVR